MGDYSHIGEGIMMLFNIMLFIIFCLLAIISKIAFFPNIEQHCGICKSTDVNYNIKTVPLYCYACWANDEKASRILPEANKRKTNKLLIV